MKLAASIAGRSTDEVKALLDGGVLKLFSVARPASPDAPITRSSLLATFRFASPAFSDAAEPALQGAVFVDNPVLPEGVGTPGFARAFAADGATPIADFAVGPGSGEIALSEVSTTPGYPVKLIKFRLTI